MNKTQYTIAALTSLGMLASAEAATILNSGGTISNAGDWSDALPGTNQNEGTIATNGNVANFNPNSANNVIVNHTSGTLTGVNNTDYTLQNSGSGNLTYNLSNGAQVNNVRVFTTSGDATLNVNGGSITHFNHGGARLQALNGGTINFNAGSSLTEGYFWAENAGSQINLLGGSASALPFGFKSVTGATIAIGGDFTISDFASTNMFQDTGGAYSIASNWSGSLSGADNWETELVTAGVTVGGTTVTAGNFGTLFNVDGSNNLTLAPVPEPSSTTLLGLGGLALILRRRK